MNQMDDEGWWTAYATETRNTLDRYKENDAKPHILGVVQLGGGKPLGNAMESHARYNNRFGLKPRRKGPGQDWHDHQYTANSNIDMYVEQKASTNRGTDSKYQWQHIEPKHPWSFLLLTGIDYQSIDYYAMSRETFELLKSTGKITNQGSKNGDSSEGYWFTYKDVKDHLVPITNSNDLEKFTSKINLETLPVIPSVPIKVKSVKQMSKAELEAECRKRDIIIPAKYIKADLITLLSPVA